VTSFLNMSAHMLTETRIRGTMTTPPLCT
jgi:hypothetical protein